MGVKGGLSILTPSSASRWQTEPKHNVSGFLHQKYNPNSVQPDEHKRCRQLKLN